MDNHSEFKEVIKYEQLVYDKSAAYWANIEPTLDGMLGGLGKLSGIDIQSSERFLKTLLQLRPGSHTHRALECGAGIGRITANLLSRYYTVIDIVEQDQKFVEQAKVELGTLNNRKGSVDNFYCSGLQDFQFEHAYDLIWVQWVLNYLNNEDLVKFLTNCRSHLTPGGLLIVKENCTRPAIKAPIPDADDSSMTRPTTHFLKIFEEAGLKLLGREKQKRFPKELFPVWTFGLVQVPTKNGHDSLMRPESPDQTSQDNHEDEEVIHINPPELIETTEVS